jgi:hypothetical protein
MDHACGTITGGYMRSLKNLLLTSVALFTVTASAASIERAKMLHANKLFDDAKKEAIAVVFSDCKDTEKADALHLLGSIAVDQEQYATAADNWTELIRRFPTSTAAMEARAKMPLVKKLIDAQSAASTPKLEIEEPGTVLVAAVAPEAPQYADHAALEFINYLASRGVRAKNAFAGRLSDATLGRSAEVALPNLMSRAVETKASAVLYVYIHFRGMENMRVECYSPDGRKLWQEKVSASLGLSPAGMTDSFVRRMKGRLEKHIGKPGLPISNTVAARQDR